MNKNPNLPKSPWIMTASGRHFHFDNPAGSAICIDDIAIALSNLCRFTGHTERFYSVAEHSVLVSCLVNPEIRGAAWAALLHDAAEAYCGDVSSPLKAAMRGKSPYALTEYDLVLGKVEQAIARRFLVSANPQVIQEVKKCDTLALLLEGEVIFGPKKMEEWGWFSRKATKEAKTRLSAHMSPFYYTEFFSAFGLHPSAAKAFFLNRFNTLHGLAIPSLKQTA